MGKSVFVLMLLAVLLNGPATRVSATTISLDEAVKKGLCKATITGNGGYYGNCIKLKLKSTCNQNLSINLEAGRRLNCVYDSIQDMLVTKNQILALLPQQTREYTIYAMCCEKHNTSPSTSIAFNLGAMAQTELVQLANLIEKLEAQNYTGQKAVWVITDDIDPEEITGSNEIVVKALKEFVTTHKTKKSVTREVGFIYDYSYPQTDGEIFTIEGDFGWEMERSGYVSLYIYDNFGNQLKMIFQDLAVGSGLQTYHYKVSDAVFESGALYWIRMKQNGRTIKELAIQMD